MIWLTWRQNRTRFLIGLGAAGLLALWLARLGFTMRSAYDRDVVGCVTVDGCDRAVAEGVFLSTFGGQVLVCSLLLIVVPLLLGLFWGAPLVAQEHEAGTQQLAWTQGVSRTRWLVTKLAVVTTAGVCVTAVLSLLLTWAASRYDELSGDRFGPVAFASRNVAPLGYAVFALALGVLAGLVLRRVVPAMALALAVLAVVGVALPTLIRPHLRTPVTVEVAFTADFRRDNDTGLFMRADESAPVVVADYALGGALMLDRTFPLLTASGDQVLSGEVAGCAGLGPGTRTGSGTGAELGIGAGPGTGPGSLEQCLVDMDLHLLVDHQPAERYWQFQWLETGLVTAAGLVLALASTWLIRR